MREVGFDSVWLVVTLLPGFFSAKMRDFFLPSRRADAFDRWFEVIAFALGNYLVAGTAILVWRIVESRFDLSAVWLEFTTEPIWGLSGALFLYMLTLSSLLLGAGFGWVVSSDLHYRIARRLGVTKRTGRDDVWQDVFADVVGGWHVVHFADGRRVLGVAWYFSDRGDKPSVYLRKALWLSDDGSKRPIEGDGILVAEAASIQCVEFISGGTA